MTKTDKARVLYVAMVTWAEWRRLSAYAKHNQWLHLDRRQAHQDLLHGMRVAQLIDDYDLFKGVLMGGEWHTRIPLLPHTPEFKPKGKPVEETQ